MKTVTIVNERCNELLPLSACGTSGWEPLLRDLRSMASGEAMVVRSTDRMLRLDPFPIGIPTIVTFRHFVFRGGPGEGICGESDRDLTATHFIVDGDRYESAGLDESGRQVFRWVPKAEVRR